MPEAERFSTPQSQRASRPVQRRGTPLPSGQQNQAMFLIGWPGPLTGCTQCCSDPAVASRWSSTAFRCPGALSQTRVWRAPQPPELVSFLPFTCGDKAVHVHPGRAAGIRGPQWFLQPNDVTSNPTATQHNGGPARSPKSLWPIHFVGAQARFLPPDTPRSNSRWGGRIPQPLHPLPDLHKSQVLTPEGPRRLCGLCSSLRPQGGASRSRGEASPQEDWVCADLPARPQSMGTRRVPPRPPAVPAQHTRPEFSAGSLRSPSRRCSGQGPML
ncbi:hypothetical protein NDU88_002769 [Pleurodeles waltl]|uniref:Uncharacterized protein n=1 Tax=Pleurodeles waltl TaxID=8319 RepID=A0AAV7UC64_PLEWA|nr:hypothetical protein NDU88_002769 [Pleurodeles waltl]